MNDKTNGLGFELQWSVSGRHDETLGWAGGSQSAGPRRRLLVQRDGSSRQQMRLRTSWTRSSLSPQQPRSPPTAAAAAGDARAARPASSRSPSRTRGPTWTPTGTSSRARARERPPRAPARAERRQRHRPRGAVRTGRPEAERRRHLRRVRAEATRAAGSGELPTSRSRRAAAAARSPRRATAWAPVQRPVPSRQTRLSQKQSPLLRAPGFPAADRQSQSQRQRCGAGGQ